MSKFTQDEWRYAEMNNTVVAGGERYKTIAHLVGCIAFPEDEYKANGRLIASAPEMYEQLNAFVSEIESFLIVYDLSVFNDEFLDLVTNAKALLERIDEVGIRGQND